MLPGDTWPFGKYKGKPWKAAPKSYFRWVRKNCDLYGHTLEVVNAVLAGRPVPPARPKWNEGPGDDVDDIVKPAGRYDDG
jgi:hypothetical protein